MHLVITCLAVESLEGAAPAEKRNEEMQYTLMERFFSGLSKKGKDEISSSCQDKTDYLSWDGVTMTDGIVTRIYNYSERLGNFSIRFLPPTTYEVSIQACAQRYSINTRALPKDLVCLLMGSNKLFGTVDLRKLPEKLETFHASENKIRGPIYLTDLPRTLKSLDFSFNKIKQKVVYYTKLPPKLKDILFAFQSVGGTIHFQPLDESDRLDDFEAGKIFGVVLYDHDESAELEMI